MANMIASYLGKGMDSHDIFDGLDIGAGRKSYYSQACAFTVQSGPSAGASAFTEKPRRDGHQFSIPLPS
ncbi:MAG: hypothetical protein K1W34_02615 [Lachnospiraceae bacterium]